MRRWQKITAGVTTGVALAGAIALGAMTRSEAIHLVTNPPASRKVSTQTPADKRMVFEDVGVRTSDGLTLHGWFIPATAGRVVMIQHGYKDTMSQYLGVAELLQRHGFNVLVTSTRAHDRNDGETISFGHHEMKDLEAWSAYLTRRGDVDADHVGMIGVSMGGAIGIAYAAGHPQIAALVADCAFSSLADTIDTSVRFFTGLPPFPFAPMIRFWMERELGFDASDIDAKKLIGRISPRAVLVMQGGADTVISVESGERLFQAAGQPKEFWFEPDVGHAQFFAKKPAAFEARITAFFDRHLPRADVAPAPAAR